LTLPNIEGFIGSQSSRATIPDKLLSLPDDFVEIDSSCGAARPGLAIVHRDLIITLAAQHRLPAVWT
jgi:hypothetical protein